MLGGEGMSESTHRSVMIATPAISHKRRISRFKTRRDLRCGAEQTLATAYEFFGCVKIDGLIAT